VHSNKEHKFEQSSYFMFSYIKTKKLYCFDREKSAVNTGEKK